jgi:RND family efflux transporter MFP subunit
MNWKWWIIPGLAVMLAVAAGCAKGKGSQAQGERTIAYYMDPMNPAFTTDKPGKAPCGMDMVPVYVGEKNAKGIRIDPAVVQNIGVKSEAVQERVLKKEIRTSGTVAFNEPKVYTVNAKVMGWVEKLHVNYLGESVSKGQALLEIYSPDLVSTQQEYLQALRYVQSLPADAAEESKRGAQNLLESARSRLLNWDISEPEIRALETRGTPGRTMTLYASEQGVVVEKMIEQGKQIEPGMAVYKIADVSTVWVMADLYQQDLPFVKVGQQATVDLMYQPGKTYTGQVTFISPVLSGEAKTAQARIEVANTPDAAIKPGMFATVRIVSTIPGKNLAVPESAVIHSGERNLVVLALPNGYFDPREITLGLSAGDYVQVLHGLMAGEKVVTSSQFLIDSESQLKSAVRMLGSGHQHGGSMPGMDMPEDKSKAQPQSPDKQDAMEGMDMK